MKLPFAVRLVLDVTMVTLVLFALAFRITGDVAHKWIGITAALLFMFHVTVNWRWFRGLFSRNYTGRRIVTTAVNIALVVTVTLTLASGLWHSKHILAFLNLPSDMTLRQVHAITAYWMLALIGVHLGMHWETILKFLSAKIKISARAITVTRLIRITGIAAVTFGAWAWIERGMFEKLCLGHSFDFWNSESPPSLFFAANLGIIGLLTLITHCALKTHDAVKKRFFLKPTNK